MFEQVQAAQLQINDLVKYLDSVVRVIAVTRSGDSVNLTLSLGTITLQSNAMVNRQKVKFQSIADKPSQVTRSAGKSIKGVSIE